LRVTLASILFWPALGVIIACVGWSLLLRSLQDDRRALERRTDEAVVRIVQAQAVQTHWNLSMVDQVLQLVRVHWQAVGGRVDPAGLKGVVGPDGLPLKLAIFDVAGRLLHTNTPEYWPPEEVEQAPALPFFTEQLRPGMDRMFIGMPRRVAGREASVVRFSRKLLGPAGEYAGVVVLVLAGDALIADFDAAALGPKGFVAAIGKDGAVRAIQVGDASGRLVPALSRLGATLGTPQGHRFLSGSDAGDGRKRYLSWAEVEGFPLVVLAAADQTAALALLDQNERMAIRAGIGATIVLAMLAMLAAVMHARFAHERHQLGLSQAAYRKATEGGNEGFYICQPVRRDCTVIDYVTLDCNDRGAAFLNLTRKTVVGSLLSSLRGHLSVTRTKQLLDHALEHGSMEIELESAANARGEPRQISLKAVRSDDVVAVTLRDITLEKAHIAHLERKNHEDALTSLPNRAWIRKALPDMLSRAEQLGTSVALLFIDLDGFKLVNDTLGHAAGDELLQIVGKRLKVAVRPNDHVVRLGGDEFIVVLENLHDKAEAGQVAARVLHAFEAAVTTAAGTAMVGTSIGISMYPGDARDFETLYRHADIAMYEVKTSGKNRYQFFDPAFYDALQARTKREKELRAAIAQRQFVMHYQARVDGRSKTVSSLEALVRWEHPTEGMLMPNDFIPLAEETGLIIHLGELVIDMVCAQLAAWVGSHYACVPVSINVSSRQFNDRDIQASIMHALQRHGIDASCVEIELTESTMVKDPDRTAQTLRAIHDLGVKLLVDDFGTGYSSLSMLHQMDFDILKVDKSFTKRLGVDEKGEIFFSAIITMAHSLGMRVVAEGVEKPEQLRILARLECDELQGYYLFRPMLASELPEDLQVAHL
jgi:diguanylate cyclase (GGDEF)-like protein